MRRIATIMVVGLLAVGLSAMPVLANRADQDTSRIPAALAARGWHLATPAERATIHAAFVAAVKAGKIASVHVPDSVDDVTAWCNNTKVLDWWPSSGGNYTNQANQCLVRSGGDPAYFAPLLDIRCYKNGAPYVGCRWGSSIGFLYSFNGGGGDDYGCCAAEWHFPPSGFEDKVVVAGGFKYWNLGDNDIRSFNWGGGVRVWRPGTENLLTFSSSKSDLLI